MSDMKMNLKDRCATLKACNVDYMKAHVQLRYENERLRRENKEMKEMLAALLKEREAGFERAYYEGTAGATKDDKKNAVVMLCKRLLEHYPRSDSVRKTIIDESEKLFAEIDS